MHASVHRRIADEYCPGAAVTKFPTKHVGARIEAPKGVGCGEGVSPSSLGRDLGRGLK